MVCAASLSFCEAAGNTSLPTEDVYLALFSPVLEAQRGAGVPIFGDTQKSPEHGPGQLVLGGLA